MSSKILRFLDGIARRADGAVCTIDISSAPTPLSLSSNWTCGISGGSPLTPGSFNASFNADTLTYEGSVRYPASGYISTYYFSTTTFSVQLVLGAGYVRWNGYFRMTASSSAPFMLYKGAHIEANVHRNCPYSTVDPRGNYVVDGYVSNVPIGAAGVWVTAGSVITLS
jgi:acetyltransferase-like isoleucine patch superfamily enzyme